MTAETQLVWTGTKHNLSKIPGCGLALIFNGAHRSVFVLEVLLLSDLLLNMHVNVVSAKCFF